MDSLQAGILEVQGLAAEQGNMTLAEELEEILEFVRRILTFEVMEKPLPDENLLGLSLDELRSMSHNPKKHWIFLFHVAGSVNLPRRAQKAAVTGLTR